MKHILLMLMFLIVSLVHAQEEPVIPIINHQFQISEPATEARTRSTNFGAILAAENDLLVIGAPAESIYVDSVLYRGAIYIYRNVDETWTFEQKIINPLSSAESDAAFGVSADIDGGRLAVGANGSAVYFYTNQNGLWELATTVFDDDIDGFDFYSAKIRLHDNLLIVADIQSDGGAYPSGSVYVYRETAGAWSLEATLTGDPTHISDYTYAFGSSIAINDDNSIIAVGEPEHPSNYGGLQFKGAVYVFKHDGPQWTNETILEGAGAFGVSLDALGTAQDTVLAVGDTGAYTETSGVSGKVHIFRNASGWAQVGEYTDPTDILYDQFGYTVKMIGTSQNPAVIVAMIPAREPDYSIDPARFYVFEIETGLQLMEMVSPGETDFDDDGIIDTDQFGRAIVIEGQGEALKIIVGAVGKSLGDGIIYVFSYDPSPEEMVESGDFETPPGRDLILDSWNTTLGAKRRCDENNCFIKFKSGVNSKVTQNVDLSSITLLPGDGVLFQADILVKGISSVKAKMKIIYVDGFVAQVNMRVMNTEGVYRRVMSAPAVFVANRPLAAIKVKFQHNGVGGSAFLDNVSLVRAAGQSAR